MLMTKLHYTLRTRFGALDRLRRLHDSALAQVIGLKQSW